MSTRLRLTKIIAAGSIRAPRALARMLRPAAGAVFEEHMPIIEEYDAIAKRLRELQKTASPKGADEITHLEKWRDLARETARVYVESRRRRIPGRPILPQPTD